MTAERVSGDVTVERGQGVRDGFSFVEAIVAIVLLAIILTSLAAHLYGISRRNMVLANDSYRDAVVMQELGRLSVIPYDNLQDESRLTFDSPPYPHRRRVEVVDGPDGRSKEVRLIIEQTSPVERTDTMVVIRTQPISGNPFNTK